MNEGLKKKYAGLNTLQPPFSVKAANLNSEDICIFVKKLTYL